MARSDRARAASVELRARERAATPTSTAIRRHFSGLTAAPPPVRFAGRQSPRNPLTPGGTEEEIDVVKKIALAAAALIGFGLGIDYAAGRGAFGAHDGPGEIAWRGGPLAEMGAGVGGDGGGGRALGAARRRRVLSGALHVHPPFSFDAFTSSLRRVGGEGPPPPADACDFARYCSSL